MYVVIVIVRAYSAALLNVPMAIKGRQRAQYHRYMYLKVQENTYNNLVLGVALLFQVLPASSRAILPLFRYLTDAKLS